MMFHRHRWVEHARTWTPPKIEASAGFEIQGFNNSLVERLMCGVTTFVFRCDEGRCGAMKSVECLGEVKVPG